jgi:hypothetical protein
MNQIMQQNHAMIMQFNIRNLGLVAIVNGRLIHMMKQGSTKSMEILRLPSKRGELSQLPLNEEETN